jgi:hypothetical protein
MKEQYIQMRNTNKFDIGWFYRYYKENGGSVDFNVFQMVFQLNEVVLSGLDKKFELTTLHDKNGNFIKVVE